MRTKTCTVCGEHAGKWHQHPNRDTGFGLCRKCADWVSDPAKRGRHVCTPLEMANLYGLPGIHYEPHLYRLYGRDFAIVAEFTETAQGQADANAFMLANPRTGLLATDAGRVILASMDDEGTPAAKDSQNSTTTEGA